MGALPNLARMDVSGAPNRSRVRNNGPPRSGSIRLEVRRRVGYLPGEYRFYENLTGGRMLEYLGHLGGAVDPAVVTGLADRLGADLARPIRTLSHGNKQKLAIVQAFMHEAPLLILDEPTTGLDPLVQQEFFALIDEARAAGRTVLLSSHNLGEVERVCDRVAILHEGRTVASGRVDEIVQPGESLEDAFVRQVRG